MDERFSITSPPVLVARALPADAASARSLRRQAGGGSVVRVRPGAFAPTTWWSSATTAQRLAAGIAAVRETRMHEPVFSHDSAALLWGLPISGPWPDAVDLADVRGTSPRSRGGIRWHRGAIDPDDIVRLGDVWVTGLERTLADLAHARGFESAVVALDHGTSPRIVLPDGRRVVGVEKAALLARIEAEGTRRGSRRAMVAVSFSDARSDSPGESVSRVNIHRLGFPAPDLQVAFERPDGGFDIVDFDWPAERMFGEFDGFGKYVRDEFTRGRGMEQVLWEEKLREDRVRMHRPRGSALGLVDRHEPGAPPAPPPGVGPPPAALICADRGRREGRMRQNRAPRRRIPAGCDPLAHGGPAAGAERCAERPHPLLLEGCPCVALRDLHVRHMHNPPVAEILQPFSPKEVG